MRQKSIEQVLREILNTWVVLIQLNSNNTTPNEVLLIDSIYNIFHAICNLFQLDGQYILDTWEKQNYNIEDTINYIIEHDFIVVDE